MPEEFDAGLYFKANGLGGGGGGSEGALILSCPSPYVELHLPPQCHDTKICTVS